MSKTHDDLLKLARELGLPLEVVTEKIDIFGQSGGGKTYLAMKIAELMLAAAAQIVVLDSAGVWWGLRSSADGKHAGYPIVVIGGEHGDLPISITRSKNTRGRDALHTSGAACADLVIERGLSVVLDVSELLDDEMVQFCLDFVTRFFWRKKRSKGPVHLFLEECQEFIPETPDLDGQVKLRAALVRLMKIGRNYGIGWSAITQEPQAASKRALNQAGTLMVVRTIGQHERKAIADTARSKAKSKEQLALIDVLPELKTGQALVWSPSWLEFAGIVHVEKKETFDSSKTPDVGEKPKQPKVLAPIELEQLRDAMKAQVEEAERDDPARLHARIRQLEAESKRPAAAAPQPAKVETKLETKTVEVNVVREKDVKRLEAVAEKLVAGQTAVSEALKAIAEALKGARVVAVPTTSKRTDLHVAVKSAPAPRAIAERPPRVDVRVDVAGLPKGEAAVLTAIAQHADGVSREQVTVLTGYKRSTRDAYIQRLKERGFVDSDRDPIIATDAGRAALGANFKPLPTGAALLDYWRGRLPAGELACLEVLVGHHPEAVVRDEVTEKTGYKRSTRDAYLQRLQARKLVIDAGRNLVRASDLLFDGAVAA